MIRKMKNKVGVFGVLLIVFAVFLLLFSANPVSAKNEFQEIYGKEGIKIGNAVFKKKNNRIMMQKDGNTVILVEDIVNDALASAVYYTNKEEALYLFPSFTDGKTLYYSKANKGSAYTTIYRMNIKTEKTEALVSGKTHTLCKIGKNHLYYASFPFDYENNAIGGYEKVYSLNLKTKEKRYITDWVGDVLEEKNKVFTHEAITESGNGPLYVFNVDGTGKKKIADTYYFKVIGDTIYYIVYKDEFKNGRYKDLSKYYKCSLNGKNKKRISKKEFDKYYKW